jgi:hypothetical protein
MNYVEEYRNLVKLGDGRIKGKGVYYEWHHVIPKCVGGSNEKSNLVLLTAREHLRAHLLLTKIYPESDNLVYALNKMLRISRTTDRQYTIDEITEAKEIYAKMMSRRAKEFVGDKNPNYGNRWTWKGKGYDKSKLKDRRKPDLSKPETRKRLREAKIGGNNPQAMVWVFRNKLTGELITLHGGMKPWCAKRGTCILTIRKGNHPEWELAEYGNSIDDLHSIKG